MNVKILLLLLSISLILSCSSEEKTKAVRGDIQSNFDKTVTAYLDSSYTKIYNRNKDFIICLEDGNMDNSKKFLVFDIERDSVIFRDNIVNGEVNWINEYDMSVLEFPGIIKKGDESIKSKYKYNVISRRKYK